MRLVDPGRTDGWRTVACAAPALFYGFVQLLPVQYGMTPFEMQLTRLGWLCLFFAPAFLPWVLFFARRAWPRAGRIQRLLLVALVLGASLPAVQAIRWAIGLVYPHAPAHRWL
jgi:hypothetical protein